MLFIDNYIVLISPDGEILRRISLFDALGDGPLRKKANDRLSAMNKPGFAVRFREVMEQFGSQEAKAEQEIEKVIALYNQTVDGSIGDDEGIITLLLTNQKEDIFPFKLGSGS